MGGGREEKAGVDGGASDTIGEEDFGGSGFLCSGEQALGER